jgi:hypothetical protein
MKPWRNAQRVSCDPSAIAFGRRAEALTKEDTLPAFIACRLLWRSRLGEVLPKHHQGLRLPILRRSSVADDGSGRDAPRGGPSR